MSRRPPGLRAGLAALLALSWLLMLGLAWRAYQTPPPPEVLEGPPRMVPPPTPASLARILTLSITELGALLLVLWPRWRRGYTVRLWLAAVGTVLWFIATVPLGLTTVVQVHRRWLAGVAALLLVAALIRTVWTAAGRVRRGPSA